MISKKILKSFCFMFVFILMLNIVIAGKCDGLEGELLTTCLQENPSEALNFLLQPGNLEANKELARLYLSNNDVDENNQGLARDYLNLAIANLEARGKLSPEDKAIRDKYIEFLFAGAISGEIDAQDMDIIQSFLYDNSNKMDTFLFQSPLYLEYVRTYLNQRLSQYGSSFLEQDSLDREIFLKYVHTRFYQASNNGGLNAEDRRLIRESLFSVAESTASFDSDLEFIAKHYFILGGFDLSNLGTGEQEHNLRVWNTYSPNRLIKDINTMSHVTGYNFNRDLGFSLVFDDGSQIYDNVPGNWGFSAVQGQQGDTNTVTFSNMLPEGGQMDFRGASISQSSSFPQGFEVSEGTDGEVPLVDFFGGGFDAYYGRFSGEVMPNYDSSEDRYVIRTKARQVGENSDVSPNPISIDLRRPRQNSNFNREFWEEFQKAFRGETEPEIDMTLGRASLSPDSTSSREYRGRDDNGCTSWLQQTFMKWCEWDEDEQRYVNLMPNSISGEVIADNVGRSKSVSNKGLNGMVRGSLIDIADDTIVKGNALVLGGKITILDKYSEALYDGFRYKTDRSSSLAFFNDKTLSSKVDSSKSELIKDYFEGLNGNYMFSSESLMLAKGNGFESSIITEDEITKGLKINMQEGMVLFSLGEGDVLKIESKGKAEVSNGMHKFVFDGEEIYYSMIEDISDEYYTGLSDIDGFDMEIEYTTYFGKVNKYRWNSDKKGLMRIESESKRTKISEY